MGAHSKHGFYSSVLHVLPQNHDDLGVPPWLPKPPISQRNPLSSQENTLGPSCASNEGGSGCTCQLQTKGSSLPCWTAKNGNRGELSHRVLYVCNKDNRSVISSNKVQCEDPSPNLKGSDAIYLQWTKLPKLTPHWLPCSTLQLSLVKPPVQLEKRKHHEWDLNPTPFPTLYIVDSHSVRITDDGITTYHNNTLQHHQLHGWKIHHFNGNFTILKWKYCSIFQAILSGEIPLHRP